MTTTNSDQHLDNLARIDKLELLFDQSYPAVFVSLIAAAVLIIALWPVQDPTILITWLSLLIFTSVARYILFFRYRRARPQGEEILAWERPYFVTLTLTTLTWGLGSIVIIPVDSMVHQVIILSFMIGLSGGAISLYSAHRSMTSITIMILLVPITMWFLLQGDAISLVLVCASVIFFLSSIRATKFIAAALNKNFILTHELRISEERVRLAATVFNHSQDGILITDVDGTIIEANLACSEITGYSREEIIGQNPNMFHSGKHTAEFYKELWAELTDSGHWQGEIWNRQKDGAVYAQRISIDAVDDEKGKRNHYVAVFHDISHLKEHEAELHEMAYHDVLTGLPNRLLLRDRMELALKQAKRNQNEITVCYLDLDGFKAINDSVGHNAGDQVLVEVAHRLLAAVRDGDTVARIGGDEFVILLVDYEDISLVETVQRILRSVSAPLDMPFGQVNVSTSIGVARAPQDANKADQLLRYADSAMYIAKSQGRNQYRMHRSE